jgi:ABC-2 type transport system ATP-binding protein
MSAIIETHALTRRYGTRRGVDDVSLRIPEGSLYGFLGPNGAGKTTTIRVLLGFLRPTEGRASVFGLDCWRDSRRIKDEIGYIPGDLRLYPWLTGRSALSLFGAIRRRDLTARGRELAALFELDLSVKVRNMSRGMRQKLGLILSLAPDPRLLVLDEPTSALDPLMQDRLQEYLRGASKRGVTVFFSSHTLGEVERLCERVAIVRGGRIVADDTLEALQRQAGHEVTIVWKPAGDRGGVAGGSQPTPTFLDLDERTDRRWSGRLRGEVGPLLGFLAGREIEDVTIAKPNLETLFREFYRPEGEPAPASGGAGGAAP